MDEWFAEGVIPDCDSHNKKDAAPIGAASFLWRMSFSLCHSTAHQSKVMADMRRLQIALL
jgi:hypothetical protein